MLPCRLASGPLLRGRSQYFRLRAAQRGAIYVYGDATVPQAVEPRIDEVFLLEQLVPVGEIEGGRDDRRHTVVALVDEAEEGIGLLRLHVEIVDLVDDKRLQAAQTLEQPRGRAVRKGGIKLIEEILSIIEAAAVAVETGLAQNADGNSGLARAGLPREHDVISAVWEVEPGQRLDLPLVEARLLIEGKGCKRPIPGQPRLFEPVGKAALALRARLCTQQTMDELRCRCSLPFG